MTVIGSLGRDLPEVKSSVNQYISAYINGKLGGVMKRIVLGCWLLLATSGSIAQTFACQYVASAGLKWENGAWVTKTFTEGSPFFIGMSEDGDTINKKTIGNLVISPTCTTGKLISCYGLGGDFLYFAPEALKGAHAITLGSIIHDSRAKDTLSISPFICQRM
jgi:hypothetical protein